MCPCRRPARDPPGPARSDGKPTETKHPANRRLGLALHLQKQKARPKIRILTSLGSLRSPPAALARPRALAVSGAARRSDAERRWGRGRRRRGVWDAQRRERTGCAAGEAQRLEKRRGDARRGAVGPARPGRKLCPILRGGRGRAPLPMSLRSTSLLQSCLRVARQL